MLLMLTVNVDVHYIYRLLKNSVMIGRRRQWTGSLKMLILHISVYMI